MKKDNIQPLKGFRDFLPQEAGAREKIFATIRTVFQRYGFLPLETPALEYREILAGKYGQEGEKLMYQFADQGGREVAMRYDLTVPLARVVAQYQNELPMPFKRYQIAPVWRADRPQKGRFREFIQCDVDVVGSKSMLADAEVIACLNAVLKELGFEDIVIRINNRKVLDGLMKAAGIDRKKTGEAIRILDKLERIGQEEVRGELVGLGVLTQQADKLFALLDQGLEDPQDIESKLTEVNGVGELAELVEILLEMRVKNYQIDLTLARGLDYYTGTIFEFVLPDAAQFGSVVGGGRYDNLVGKLSNKSIPAVGGSIGIDRVLAALEELEILRYDTVADVLVCNLGEELEEKYLEIVGKLRAAGIKTDFYYEPVKLDRQLKYADQKNINFVVLLGPEEIQGKYVQVKNMKTGGQDRPAENNLVDYLRNRLNS